MRPTIGISSGFTMVHTIGGGLPSHYASTHLIAAVWKAGGMPWILPAIPEAAEEVAERLDGLLLAGGADVSPALYGEEPGPHTVVDERRDHYEARLIELAVARAVPIFGACRGIQILTAARGGSLYQHLPTDRPGSIAHLQPLPGNQLHHTVAIDPNSRLAAILGDVSVQTNSLHHQGVAEPGPELQAVGWTEDGLIEAVEMPGAWVLAVQWHPELLHKVRSEAMTLFRAFVRASQDQMIGA